MMLPNRGAWRKRCGYRKKSSRRLFIHRLSRLSLQHSKKVDFWMSTKVLSETWVLPERRPSVVLPLNLDYGLIPMRERQLWSKLKSKVECEIWSYGFEPNRAQRA